MNTRTELENKMVQKLQMYLDEVRKARAEKDKLAERYWEDRLYYAEKFVDDVTGKVVRINKWRVTLEDEEV